MMHGNAIVVSLLHVHNRSILCSETTRVEAGKIIKIEDDRSGKIYLLILFIMQFGDYPSCSSPTTSSGG